MYRGLSEAVVGNRIGDIGAAIQEYAESRGYGVVRDLVGHGVGPTIRGTNGPLTMVSLVVVSVSVKEWC